MLWGVGKTGRFGRFSISKQLQFISFISNYFWQSSVKSNKQARSNRETDRWMDGWIDRQPRPVAAGVGQRPFPFCLPCPHPSVSLSLRLPKGRVIAGDLTTTLEDKYFMKSHKQIKDESQTRQRKEKEKSLSKSKSIGKKRRYIKKKIKHRIRRSNMTTQPR